MERRVPIVTPGRLGSIARSINGALPPAGSASRDGTLREKWQQCDRALGVDRQHRPKVGGPQPPRSRPRPPFPGARWPSTLATPERAAGSRHKPYGSSAAGG
jgi:hypothetical protein